MQQQYFLDQTYTINTTKIYKKYKQNIHKYTKHIQKYTTIHKNTTRDIQKIYKKYIKIYKYTKNIQQYTKKCIQNIYKKYTKYTRENNIQIITPATDYIIFSPFYISGPPGPEI